MKFNRNKPFGTISPPYKTAMYQQGDQYYDAEYKRVAKLSAKPTLREVMPVDVAPIGTEEAKLLVMADDPSVTWQEFRKASRVVLDECPTTKEGIIEALKNQIVNMVIDRSAGPSKPKAAAEADTDPGMTWGEEKGEKRADPPPPPPEEYPEEDNEPVLPGEPEEVPRDEEGPSEPNDGPVDLAAWAKGQAGYLFSDVQKAIRAQFARQVSKKNDALDLWLMKALSLLSKP